MRKKQQSNGDGTKIQVTAWMNEEGTEVRIRTATGEKTLSAEAFRKMQELMPYASFILFTNRGNRAPKKPGAVTIRFQDAA